MPATFTEDYKGIGEMMAQPYMIDGLFPFAIAIKGRAAATAPRSSGRQRKGKSYAESFNVSGGIGATNKGRIRAYARVSNSSHIALYVEYGNKRIPAHRTLRKAAGIKDFSKDKVHTVGGK